MTTERKTLTDRLVKSSKVDVYDDLVTGFMLRVRSADVKSFALFARMPGEKNATRRTISRVGVMSLADARQQARDWKALIQRGIDPRDERQAQRDDAARKRKDTIAAVFEAYRTIKIKPLKTADEIEQMFDDILIPLFGERPIAALTHVEVSTALREIEQHGTDRALVNLRKRIELRHPNRKAKPARKMARALFSYLDGFLRWAAGTGDYGLEFSPLIRVKKSDRFCEKIERDRVLSDIEIAAVWRAMGTLPPPYRQLYRLLFLTGLRLREITNASWDEFDPKLTEWTIPAARMKGKKGKVGPHTVPITAQMRALLHELHRGNRGSFVFSLNGGERPIAFRGRFKSLLDAAVLADMGLPDSALDSPKSPIKHFTNHDLRRTLRTCISKLGVSDAIGEAILAHKKKGMQAIYNRYDLIDERRAAHELWGDFLIKLADERKIVRLRRAA